MDRIGENTMDRMEDAVGIYALGIDEEFEGKGISKWRLNDKQREFAEKNHGLLWKYMNDARLNDEWYGLLAEAYCKAVKSYSPDMGVFSIWAYTFMGNAVKTELQRQSRLKVIPKKQICSYNFVLSTDEFGHELTIEDITEDESVNVEDEAIARCMVRGIRGIAGVDPRLQTMIDLLLAGYNCTEIAQKNGDISVIC